MPRCQRTFTGLAAGPTPWRWVCPHCADAEIYEAVRDADLTDWGDLALRTCAAEFGTPPDAARPVLLLLGLRPECVLEPGERRYDLYLQRGSDPLQLRLQIGHEMFHRVCSRGRVFHWTHEMLACMLSVRLLRRFGLSEYADATEAAWIGDPDALDADEIVATDLWRTPDYPAGFYSGVFNLGRALEAAAGWDALRRLGMRPDVPRWRDTLPADAAEKVRRILEPEKP